MPPTPACQCQSVRSTPLKPWGLTPGELRLPEAKSESSHPEEEEGILRTKTRIPLCPLQPIISHSLPLRLYLCYASFSSWSFSFFFNLCICFCLYHSIFSPASLIISLPASRLLIVHHLYGFSTLPLSQTV